MPKILVVEDNEMNRDMLTRRLIRRGFEVITANDGREAVECCQRERPDLVLMDMSLPIMDGWEATRQLKTTPETCRIPVIALTAHAMAGDRERAFEAGCNDYDTKPITLSALIEKMEALLHQSSKD